MNPTKSNPDALAYLLGGVALLAISAVPVLTITMPEVQPIGKVLMALYWLVGGAAIWWATRRFQGLGERIAALIGIVVGWYIILQILIMLETMVFRF